MGLHLDSGAAVMAFRLRSGKRVFRSGTWIGPGGEVTPLSTDQLSLTPIGFRDTEQGRVPDRWQLDIPSKNLSVTVTTRSGEYWNQGLFPYWESPATVTGSATGRGYIELTGYRKADHD
ncbi:MAG: lipocalin family protein, partial [Marinobacter sp.]|nr:lipocalin family protein [Marinobacter sp.]